MLTKPKTRPNHNKKQAPESKVITPRQSGSLVASTLLGVGVLTMSRTLAETVKEAAWLVTLLGGLVSLFFLLIIARLSFRFPLKSIASYSEEILGFKQGKNKQRRNWLGKILSFPIVLGFIMYWVLTVAITVRSFGEVVVSALLPTTPLEIIILTMLILGFILTCFEIEVVARVNELILPFIAVPLIIITLLALQEFKLEFFLPLWPDISLKDFCSGILLGTFSYIGYEVMTVFGGYTFVTKATLPITVIAFMAPVLIYTAVVILSIGVFGIYELNQLLWPTLELIKAIEVPGIILQRVESAFLAVWMAAVFTTSANLLYAASFLVKKVMARGSTFVYSLLFLPFIYWVSLIPQNVFTLFIWTEKVGYLALIFSGALPLFLYIVACVRKIGLSPAKQLDNTEANGEG
jgi:spore germination protein